MVISTKNKVISNGALPGYVVIYIQEIFYGLIQTELGVGPLPTEQRDVSAKVTFICISNWRNKWFLRR